MKHLKSINELLKSTLVSAARKAKSNYEHPERSKALLNWAEERGENVPVDRIFPHPFTFDWIYPKSTNSYFKQFVSPINPGSNPPYFYITNWEFIEDRLTDRNNFYEVRFKITFKSNWGETVFLEVSLNTNTLAPFKAWLKAASESIYIKFSSKRRKDAVQFKKFLLEDLTPEFLEDIENYFSSCSSFIKNKFERESDKKFLYFDEDGYSSVYIGFFKDIPINSMLAEY